MTCPSSQSKVTAFFLHGFGFLAIALLLSSCATSRPDLVWSEDGSQHGLASWYDDQGQRTANGELFNMYALTAAHPSLALNSIVEVRNLKNDKKVTVRVNDRLPPIHEGRVIDLSKGAFSKLDSLSVGVLDVEVKVLQYGNNQYVKLDKAAPSGKMYLANQSPASKSTTPSKTVAKKSTSGSPLPVAAQMAQ
jgi:rare lipoprotein A